MSKLKLAGGSDNGSSQVVSGVRMPNEISMRLVEELLPYARNSRTHSDGQIATLARNIARFGWTNPVLVADCTIIAGHGRLLAAKKLGLVRVPCIDLSHLSSDDRRALVISDNRISELAGWSLDDLKVETDYLREVGFDLEADIGFAEDDLSSLLSGLAELKIEGDADPDAVPSVPEIPISVLGDIWCIGEHRVMCGSSLKPFDWDQLMGGDQADAVWTDPPFNVNQGRKNRELDKTDGGNRAKSGAIQNDKMSDKDFYAFLLGFFSALLEQMKAGAPLYVAHPDSETINFLTAFRDAGFKQQGTVIWNKNVHVLGRHDHQARTESLIYGWKPGAAHKWYGGRKNTNVLDLGEDNPFSLMPDGRWQVRFGDTLLILTGDVTVEQHASDMIHEARPAKSTLHPTMKPVNLIARQLKNSARTGDVIADGFGGSGSTAIAAHQLGMKARLMEIDPRFVDVCVSRLESFSGLRAVHAITGIPFPRDGEVREPAPALPEPALDDGSIF